MNKINFNGHYIFEVSEWSLYPLTGVNISSEKVEIEIRPLKETEETTEFGINMGLGVYRQLESAMLFAEYDHLFNNL